MIQEGGVVYGVTYTDDCYGAEYVYADRQENIQRFKGSKYVYAKKMMGCRSVYEDVAVQLLRGRNVLFVGLGCDIGALNRIVTMRGTDRSSLFTVELICDGVMEELTHKRYIQMWEVYTDSEVMRFVARQKRTEWLKPYVYLSFANHRDIFFPYNNSMYEWLFASDKRKCCYKCCFRGDRHQGDLLVGDLWGCHQGDDNFNARGVSLMIVQNQKGEALLQKLDTRNFLLQELDNAEQILVHNPRIINDHKQSKVWSVLHERLQKQPLLDVLSHLSERTKSFAEWQIIKGDGR